MRFETEIVRSRIKGDRSVSVWNEQQAGRKRRWQAIASLSDGTRLATPDSGLRLRAVTHAAPGSPVDFWKRYR